MGNSRLGELLKTRAWRQVVWLISDDASAPQIASATWEAALKNINKASEDPSFTLAFYLVADLAHSAREFTTNEFLDKWQIARNTETPALDLITSYNSILDHQARIIGRRTDLGEIAQQAASETLTHLLSEKTSGLFETKSTDVHQVLHDLGTTKNFGQISQEFFSRFLQRTLTYFLSRELPNHVGPGRRFANLEEHDEFRKALSIHSRQTAKIMEEYAGKWYSKRIFEGNLTQDRVKTFIWRSLQKIKGEINREEPAHD
jgi:hypothetical protein